MMGCSCRTASLRIFLQSLTEFRVSNTTITTATQRIQARCPRIDTGYRPQCVSSRPYSTTAAIRVHQQTSSGLASRSEGAAISSESAKQDPASDAAADGPSAPVLQASPGDLDRARRDGAVLEYSPESIDSIVADVNKSLKRRLTPRHKQAEPPVYPEADPDLDSASPAGSSKLKRLKIIKEDEEIDDDDTWTPPEKEQWMVQKSALKGKFPGGWSPRKRLSPDALDGIRALHSQFPEDYTTEVLAEKFEVSAEAIRRILRSKWTPSTDEEISRQERWFNRGKNIWSQMAALGKKPPRRWRKEGIVREHHWNEPWRARTQASWQRRKLEEGRG
ncbi:hypothetical protein GGR54DRAFT_15412 [Hypoxylon sp. NC1633]|nr:hypothetical protein GGR54DRAFT_15412 [Hypoxylon sp. NC1633]